MMNDRFRKQLVVPRKQQGSILLVTIVIVLMMMIASIGLMRSVESGNVAAANIAMAQNNQLVADWGVERGFEWLYSNRTNLDNNNASSGYYAIHTVAGVFLNDTNWLDAAKWAGAKVYNSGTTPAPPAGYTVRVMINRMCANAGAVNASGQSCSKGATTTSSAGNSNIKIGGVEYGIGSAGAIGNSPDENSTNYVVPGNVYYRVTVRVEGPRNSLSVVQSMLTVAPT